jgi:hypothetical protein
MAINLNLPTMMGTPYTTEADKLISDIRSFQAPNIPSPPPTIPKLTGFGDKLARIGGFGDEPGELKTKEELEKMTQAEIDAYVRQRKQARRLGTSEALIQFGEALQGKPAAQNALAREQARKNIELQNQYQVEYENAIRMAEQTDPQKARLLRSLGLPGYINVQQKRAEQMFTSSGELFKGQGVVNQFYNVLLQGQQDESVRQSPMYKTAYDYLSQPKTETYINEVGQQVTRKIPGMISKGDYLPPVGVTAADEKPVVTEPKEEEVVKVSPERRKTLQTQIDTVNNSERKILAFQKKLDEIQPNPLTRGEDRADIQSQYTSLLLELKNLEELGVLAGPDLDLLQSMVGDPTGFQQFFISGGTAGIKKQLDNLLSSISDRKTPIYTELGMEVPKGTITQTKQTAYLKGKKIEVNATGDGWIYSETGQAVQ